MIVAYIRYKIFLFRCRGFTSHQSNNNFTEYMYHFENNSGSMSNNNIYMKINNTNIYTKLKQKDINVIRQRHFGILRQANNKTPGPILILYTIIN